MNFGRHRYGGNVYRYTDVLFSTVVIGVIELLADDDGVDRIFRVIKAPRQKLSVQSTATADSDDPLHQHKTLFNRARKRLLRLSENL